ncbi:hypothetical protein Tco_1307818 [Tanacetum coccineum]
MKPRRARALSITIHSSIKAKIMEAQSEASKDVNTPAKILRTLIMNEAHATKYSVHPGADKVQSKTPETLRIAPTASDSQVEMGEYHYGLHNEIAENQ